MSADRKKPYAVNILLFLLTLGFTLVIGVQYHVSYHAVTLPAGMGFFGFLWRHPSAWLWGISYSFSLLTILLVHELGHFFACRAHGIEATLPFFIPAPTLIGTFGAFIKIKSPFSSKKALFDVGLAGPLAGFLAALPFIVLGLAQSRIIDKQALANGLTLGEPLVFKLISLAGAGERRRAARPAGPSHGFRRLVRPFGHGLQPFPHRPAGRRPHPLRRPRQEESLLSPASPRSPSWPCWGSFSGKAGCSGR